MSHDVAVRCIELLDASPTVKTMDITGGAPELCPEFKYLVTEARKRGIEVIDRCNLTVLEEPGQEDLGQFLAKHEVRKPSAACIMETPEEAWVILMYVCMYTTGPSGGVFTML